MAKSDQLKCIMNPTYSFGLAQHLDICASAHETTGKKHSKEDKEGVIAGGNPSYNFKGGDAVAKLRIKPVAPDDLVDKILEA